MKTTISNDKNPTDKHKRIKVEALADSGATHSIISFNLAKKVNMIMFEKGEATLTNASNTRMDVSGRGEITVQEELGFPHKISVLISKDLGRQNLSLAWRT